MVTFQNIKEADRNVLWENFNIKIVKKGGDFWQKKILMKIPVEAPENIHCKSLMISKNYSKIWLSSKNVTLNSGSNIA